MIHIVRCVVNESVLAYTLSLYIHYFSHYWFIESTHYGHGMHKEWKIGSIICIIVGLHTLSPVHNVRMCVRRWGGEEGPTSIYSDSSVCNGRPLLR